VGRIDERSSGLCKESRVQFGEEILDQSFRVRALDFGICFILRNRPKLFDDIHLVKGGLGAEGKPRIPGSLPVAIGTPGPVNLQFLFADGRPFGEGGGVGRHGQGGVRVGAALGGERVSGDYRIAERGACAGSGEDAQ